MDLLEAEQPGLDNTSLKKVGVYDEIQKESNAPSKAGHLHIQKVEDGKEEYEEKRINTAKKHRIKDPFPSSKEAVNEALEVGNSGLDNKTLTHPSPKSIMENNAPSTTGHLPHYSHNNKKECWAV